MGVKLMDFDSDKSRAVEALLSAIKRSSSLFSTQTDFKLSSEMTPYRFCQYHNYLATSVTESGFSLLKWSGRIIKLRSLLLSTMTMPSSCSIFDSSRGFGVDPLIMYTTNFCVAMNELCPFHPKHDIYAIHEQMKNKISDYDWECQMCGKRFYTENTFDLHIGNRHETNAYSTSRTICLSSYCSLLRCSVLKPDIDYGYQVFWDEALCDPKSFEAISKQCEDILNKCTPSGNDSSSTQIRRKL
ncbi:unnamed protein product [Schistosoma mattheei]|uniref:Uncharacterized protein n=1 Tax=Schistosoma mattheei TaxID=31246 RepID=A0A183NX95_9TREM|nr:unnamed protein product [Schistosoma mattheei]